MAADIRAVARRRDTLILQQKATESGAQKLNELPSAAE
jgi:DNA-directed RNA polymerase subunit beta'